jgi:hypothetical protein
VLRTLRSRGGVNVVKEAKPDVVDRVAEFLGSVEGHRGNAEKIVSIVTDALLEEDGDGVSVEAWRVWKYRAQRAEAALVATQPVEAPRVARASRAKLTGSKVLAGDYVWPPQAHRMEGKWCEVTEVLHPGPDKWWLVIADPDDPGITGEIRLRGGAFVQAIPMGDDDRGDQ